MKKYLLLPLIVLIVSSCNSADQNMSAKNAETAESFIDLFLNDPESAKDLLHDDFKFRYMGKIPIYAQDNVVIKTSYDKDAYFSEFADLVGKLLPDGISLTTLDVIADDDSAAVIMVGDAKGKYGEYDNEYVFTYKFVDGKIIAIDEYNSDVLVAESLYGNTLVPNESTNVNQLLVEYVWQKKGPNFNETSFNELTAKWNSIIDELGCQMSFANVITPRFESENFDFIWQMVWPSEDARNACWDGWLKDYNDEWLKTIDGVWTYDPNNAFLFGTEVGRFPKAINESGAFTESYFFCNFKEGADEKTLHDYRADVNGITSMSDQHWYVFLEPMFDDENNPDFLWLDIWANQEDREADLAIWSSTDLPKRAEDMVICNDNGIEAAIFDGRSIR
jgi:ketosteroid isomerase-like protein